MSALRSRYISPAEADLLRYELSLGSGAKSIKRGLQRLCMFYEAGRRLEDPTNHRQLIHSHLSSPDILLRRWSMKALGLIGHRDDMARIVTQLRVETDAEAQTWGAAALLKNADDRSMTDLCAEAKLENSVPLILAGRLYAPKEWLDRHWRPVTVSLHDDDLTLKWAVFLIGYGRAPDELFDPKHENRVFLGELNQHDTPEISEYSIWALWERPELGVSDLSLTLEQIMSRPENARKWLYRLCLQDPEASGVDSSVVHSFRRDQAVSAREGLALGLADVSGAGFDLEIMDWYHDEDDAGIRETLLTAMARRAHHNPDFADVVERKFLGEAPDSGMRRRLLAATEGTSLYRRLKGIELQSEFTRQGLLQFGPAANYYIGGDFNQVAGSHINVGGNLTAQNVVGGNMSDSANNAVQSIGSDREQDRLVLQQVLGFIKSTSLSQGQRAELEGAVRDAATASTPDAKKRLLDSLKGAAKAIGLAGSAALGITKLIEAVSHWAG